MLNKEALKKVLAKMLDKLQELLKGETTIGNMGETTIGNIKSLLFGLVLGVSTALMIPKKYYNRVPIKWIKNFKSWLFSKK